MRETQESEVCSREGKRKGGCGLAALRQRRGRGSDVMPPDRLPCEGGLRCLFPAAEGAWEGESICRARSWDDLRQWKWKKGRGLEVRLPGNRIRPVIIHEASLVRRSRLSSGLENEAARPPGPKASHAGLDCADDVVDSQGTGRCPQCQCQSGRRSA